MDIKIEIYNDVKTMTTLIADAVVKVISPKKDDLTTNEAYRDYGRHFVKRLEDAGVIKAKVVGNKRVFSKHELDCARAIDTTVGKREVLSVRH